MARLLQGKRKLTFGIKVSEIPDSISERDLKSTFNTFGTISSAYVKNSKPLKHAYINYESQHSAKRAAEKMNRFEVSGGILQVKAKDADQPDCKRHRSAGSRPSNPNTTSLSPDVLSNKTATKGSTADTKCNSNQFSIKISNISPNTTQVELSKLFKTAIFLKSAPGNKSFAYANYKSQYEMEDALKLHNRLIDGLKIQVKMTTSSKNTGLVQSQHSMRGTSEAQRIIPIHGVKLLYILKMFPNLQSNVLKDFGVTIRGFQAGSTKLFLSGPTQSLDKPSLIITRILNGHNVTTEACIGLLIPSAQTRISLEKLPVVLCASTENGNDFCYAKEFSKRPTKITLSICGPENALLKVKAILKSPKKKELSLANTSVLQKLKESPSCNFPYLLCQYGVYILEHVHTTGCSLTVQGYVEGEVDTAFSILSNAAAKFHSRTYCYSKIFQYECHPNFKFQIQECIVKPLQQQLSMGVSISFLDSDKILPLEKFSGSRGKNTITIVTKSNNSKDFMAACERLKKLKPVYKSCVWPKEEFEFLSREMIEEIKEVEQCNHVYVELKEGKENSTVLHGFSVDDVSASEDFLRDFVDSNLEVKLSTPVTRYDNLFIQKKYSKILCDFCSVRFPTSSDFQVDNANLILRGTKMKVNMAKQRVCETISMLKVRSFECRYDSYGEMWKRLWHKLKKRREEAHNIVIDLHAVVDNKYTRNLANIGLTLKLALIGQSLSDITEAEHCIKSIKTELLHKTVSLNSAQFIVAVDGISSKKICNPEKWIMEVVFDSERHTIELVTPVVSSEDLDAAYKTVIDYINGVPHCIDMVCLQNSSLCTFLQCNQQKWQHFVRIANKHSVWIMLLRGSIEISGKTNDVNTAKKFIVNELQEISKLFKVMNIKVDDMLEPILDTLMFKGVVARSRQDYGVVVSFRRQEVVHTIQVKKPDDSLFTIEICRGNILDETSDAVVNIIKCGTLNALSLSEELNDAGGPTIQQEYSDYVKRHGALDFCMPICFRSGCLRCKLLIHVKPVPKVYGHNGEIVGLDKAITNVLLLTEKHMIGSLSIPLFDSHAVSECAKTSLESTLNLCTKGSLKCLKLVRFVLPTMELADEFKQKLLELQATVPSVVVALDKLSTDQSYNWFWENEFGCLEAYAAEDSDSLSQQFRSNSPVGKLIVKGSTYTINFAQMVQVNDHTLYTRRIEKRQVQPIWKYKNNVGQWDLYTEQQSQAIETMWQTKTSSVLQIGKWKYAFNLDTTPMTQTNMSTNKCRFVCRMDCKIAQNIIKPIVDHQLFLLLEGPIQTINQASNEIDEFLKSNLVNEEVPLAVSLPPNVVNDVITKHSVKTNSFTPNQVVLKGIKDNVVKATMEIKDIILKDYILTVSYPAEWEVQNEDLELKPLHYDTPEWSKVSQQFSTTLDLAIIVKIERIQNKWLWEKYSHHSERMKKRNRGISNEKMLFHGTRGTPPSKIFKDKVAGFDMRFSNAGMWGKGNYFAADAKYSNSYAHCLPNGVKQMFLAKVLTGISIQLQPDNSLQMPPVMKSSNDDDDIRYDTVTGYTRGTQVYITYSNDQAYPFYLISYIR